MLVSFGFSTIAVMIADLLFLDPDPLPGQDGSERGVRLGIRRINHEPDHGSIYAARPISVDEPLWRADLLESAAGPVGSFDRTHHHSVDGWEVSERIFDPELTADPVAWVRRTLSSLGTGVLGAVAAGELAVQRDGEPAAPVRDVWL